MMAALIFTSYSHHSALIPLKAASVLVESLALEILYYQCCS
jgi:hypothetical protein